MFCLQAFIRLNHLGLTLSTDAVRSSVDKLRTSYDKELMDMKEKMNDVINQRARMPRRRLFNNEGIIFPKTQRYMGYLRYPDHN